MKKIVLILSLLLITVSLSASKRRNKDSDISLLTSYIIPIDNTDFNTSLSLGLGARFWGIFQLSAHGYMETNKDADKFSESFYAPEVFSAGVGINIPMGGFRLKGDYQRFFSVKDNVDRVSISQYSDSYKLGIGVNLNHFLEAEVYHRTLVNSDAEKYFDEKQSFLGLGINIFL